jgi:hypothetical protein
VVSGEWCGALRALKKNVAEGHAISPNAYLPVLCHVSIVAEK